jgi:hypothetical protein
MSILIARWRFIRRGRLKLCNRLDVEYLHANQQEKLETAAA